MWWTPQETAEFVTFTEKIFNRNYHFLGRANSFQNLGELCEQFCAKYQFEKFKFPHNIQQNILYILSCKEK